MRLNDEELADLHKLCLVLRDVITKKFSDRLPPRNEDYPAWDELYNIANTMGFNLSVDALKILMEYIFSVSVDSAPDRVTVYKLDLAVRRAEKKNRDHETPKLEKIEKNFAPPNTLGGLKTKEETLIKGNVRFSSYSFFPDGLISPEQTIASGQPKLSLDWQSYSELQSTHGEALLYEILSSEGFGVSGGRDITQISAEIAKEVGKSSWNRIESHLSKFKEGSGHKEVFLTAIWAQVFADPLEELWLAAMAQHAYFVLEDDFAFGYLIAQIDQKSGNETHFLRGKKIVESASEGGKEKSRKVSERTNFVINEMARLQKLGHSVTRSAVLAYKNEFGTSADANRKLWIRHSKK